MMGMTMVSDDDDGRYFRAEKRARRGVTKG